MEIEVKLTIPDAVTADLIRGRESWAGYDLVAGRSLSLVDTYIDTRRGALRRAGWACRVRRGAETLVATLKSLGGAEKGLHRREEIEQAIDADGEPSTWPDGAVKAEVLRLCGAETPGPLCTIRQERFAREVVEGQRRVALQSVDAVTVEVGDSARRWWELEVELLPDGTEADLFAMRDWAVASFGLAPSAASKLETALAFAALHRRRPARGSAAGTPVELESPQGADEASLLSALEGMGFTVQRMRSVEARVSFFDTREAAATRRNRSLRFRDPPPQWQICNGESVIASVAAEDEGRTPPTPLTDRILPAPSGSPWLLQMRAELVETRYRLKGSNTLPLGLRIRHWSVHSPEDEGARHSIVDLSLEGPPGSSDIEYLVSVLVKRLGCRVPARPLLTRGLGLLGMPVPGESLPAHLVPRPDDTPGGACRRVLGAEAWRLRRSLNGAIRNEDPEFVHEMRVATRRARSAVRLFGDSLGGEMARTLHDELAWVGGLLGAARDLDVLMARCIEGFEAIVASPHFRETLMERLKRSRGEAQTALVDALRSERFTALLAVMEESPDPGARGEELAPLVVFAVKRINRAFERLSPWMQRKAADIADTDLHPLRIRFKRARYACEFFLPVLGDLQGLARAFVPYQDSLGRIQDAFSACDALSEIAEMWLVGGANGPELMGMGALIQVQREKLALERLVFARLWESVSSLGSRWEKVKRMGPA
ncbi:MAG TPA: CHAD domain-containing protein [Spirochaetia bacterium]